MKIAIISDIHGNHNALRSVLEDIDANRIDKIFCLGDCIGYGPEPEQVINEIQRRAIPCIMGNHEMAVCDRLHMDWFNPMARYSLEKTITMLSPDSMSFIQQLHYSLITDGCCCVHGYPPESARTYLFQKSTEQIKRTCERMDQSICFVGHTHVLELISFDGSQIDRRPLAEGLTSLAAGSKYIVNVGSVGQPRDGNNKAKYVIWDNAAGHLETRFIPYDIADTVAKIKSAGLPEVHANRLW